MADARMSRIAYADSPEVLFWEVAQASNLGNYLAYVVMPVGYEDPDVRLDTAQGR